MQVLMYELFLCKKKTGLNKFIISCRLFCNLLGDLIIEIR